MPLIDEQTRATDRRTPLVLWPWVLAIGVLVLLLMLGAVSLSFLPRTWQSTAATPTQQTNSMMLQQADSMHRYGNSSQAVKTLQTLDLSAPMSVMDKHTYLRLAAESNTQGGSPAVGAKFYDRYLSWSTQVHNQECRSCHSPQAAGGSGIAPTQPSDATRSVLGERYATALTAARSLGTTRRALRAQLKKTPEDPRLHLLLYHLDKAAGDEKAAASHADKLRELDVRR